MTVSPAFFTALCPLAVAALLLAEFKHLAWAQAVFKTLASLAFIAVALALGAPATLYGSLVLAALVLSLAGDVLLLSARPLSFLAGLLAFLLAHAGYAAAFVSAGVAVPAACAAALLALPLAALVLKWLWPWLGASYRAPVAVYVVVILVMCSFAVGRAALDGRWWVAAGALVFAASDLAVARQQFVCASPINKTWGLPAYYLAQLLLAWSVAGAR